MTDRERWTVYPLLFLALGVSLKDKLTESVDTKSVRCETMVCNELTVANPKGADNLRVVGGTLQTRNLVCNTITVADAMSKQRVQITNGGVQAANMVCGALVVADANGKEAVAVSANEHGGFLRTHGAETGTITFLGNTDRIAGLLFIDAQGAIHPGPFFTSPAGAKKPDASEPPSPDAPATPSAPAPQQEPAAEKKDEEQTPAEASPPESGSEEEAVSAQPASS